MLKSFIICGPNGSGKSVLGEKLATDLKLPYHHAGPSPGGWSEGVKCCDSQLLKIIGGCVLDRCTPISEPIYNVNLDKVEREIYLSYLKRMLMFAKVIYCTGDGEFTNKPYYPPGHYEFVLKEKKTIRKRYEKAMKIIPHTSYDFETDELPTLKVKYEKV